MKIIYPIAALLLIAGCTSHVEKYDQTIAQQYGIAQQAQAQVDVELPRCTGGRKMKTLPPHEYLQAVKCFTALVEQKVVPVTPYPEPMKRWLYTNLENAALYSQGQISYEQMEARGKLAVMEMDAAMQSQHNDIRNQYGQVDANENANFARALQGLKPPRQVYTTCSTFGSTTQCRSQ
jgi:hypothetical protein